MNIHQKINAIMSEVTYIYKDGQISFGQTKYRAVTEENVLSIIRPKLIKYHINIYPFDLQMSKEGQITSSVMKFMVVNADNPDDFFLVMSGGQGSDTQDKGAGKSITYAEKYCLLKLFLVPTGDDPDKISSEELDAKQEKTDRMAETLQNHILELAGGDLQRVNVFINKLFATDGTRTLYDLGNGELVQLDQAISKKVKNAT